VSPLTSERRIQCEACGLEYLLKQEVPEQGARYRCRCGASLFIPATQAAQEPDAPLPDVRDSLVGFALEDDEENIPTVEEGDQFAIGDDERVPTIEDPNSPGYLGEPEIPPVQEWPEGYRGTKGAATPSESPQHTASKSKLRRMLGWIVKGTLTLVLLGLLGGLGVFVWLGRDLPPLDSLRDYRPFRVTEVYSADGQQIGAYFEEQRYVVDQSELPDYVPMAFVAAEDGDFYSHGGVDPLALFRAVFINVLQGRKAQGASTITQQVARTFSLTRQKKYSRKVREMILAWRI